MSHLIERLFARTDIETTYPAKQSEIDAVSRLFEAPPPELLMELWRESDGIGLSQLNVHLLGPTEAHRLIAQGKWNDVLVRRGWLPLLDDHQSNFLAVNLKRPLAFRATYLPHDDGSRLIYRSFESCMTDLLALMDKENTTANTYFSDTLGDYAPDTPRSENDQETARILMQTAGQGEEWNYAAQLLDASNLQEWAKLLETDHFVRRDVRARMRQMTSPAIRDLLRKDDARFEAFVNWVADLARKAGVNVGRRERDALQVGGKWMNLDAFFYRRNIPDAGRRLVAGLEDLIAGRGPHDRTGHFMAD